MALEDGKIEVGGRKLQVVTIDFETYYDKGYTLSGKLNTSEYIRDERFHVHGVGIKIGNERTKWYTGKNIAQALGEIDWSRTALCAHNTSFDGFILSEVFCHKPAFYLDTLSMARAALGHHTRHDLDTVAKALGFAGKVKRSALADTKGKMSLTPAECAALGAYCVDDTNDTYGIFWKLYDAIPDEELQLINLTIRMFCDPVLTVDLPRVQSELEKEVGGKVAALLKSGTNAEDLLSNNKFAALLNAEGCSAPMKVSPVTGKAAYAFAKSDEAFKLLLDHQNPKIRALAEARLKIKSTIGETRAVRFLEAGKGGNKLPILLHYSGAHTHRWSGGNKMNLQNLVRGGELRKSIMAPKGHVVVVADSAQIEARVLAWVAGQMDILAAFANKRDLYSEFAALVFNKPIAEITKKERHVGKVCILGLGYGMGAEKLQGTLKAGALGGPPIEMSLDECRRIVKLYRSKNSKIQQFWKKMDQVILAMATGATGTLGPITYGKNYICLPNGMFLQYYGMHGEMEVRYDNVVMTEATYLTRYGRTKIYGGLLTENLVQALARVIVADQMLAISKKYRVVTMTHDEVVAICPKDQAKQCLADMLKIMATPPSWAPDMPLAAEGGYDICYSK